ncbi:MAG: enoyl-CoA hydratase-related protein, partial [Promethearchaeia archaeon]
MQVNALARHIVEELPALLTALEADPEVKVIVFASAKKDFIVGADINMFKELASSGKEGVRSMVKQSHPVFDMM